MNSLGIDLHDKVIIATIKKREIPLLVFGGFGADEGSPTGSYGMLMARHASGETCDARGLEYRLATDEEENFYYLSIEAETRYKLTKAVQAATVALETAWRDMNAFEWDVAHGKYDVEALKKQAA